MERPDKTKLCFEHGIFKGNDIYHEQNVKHIDHLESLLNEDRIVGILEKHQQLRKVETNLPRQPICIMNILRDQDFKSVAKEITKGGKE